MTFQDGREPTPHWSRLKKITVWSTSGVVGFFVLMFIIGTVAGPPKTADSKPIAKATASTASPSPSVATVSISPPPAPTPTTPSPKPSPTTVAPTTKPPTKATPTEKTCGPERDVDVWMKVPGLSDSAQVLGSYDLATCEPTFQLLQETSPTGAGYCTEAAWASDNPGYNADADPATRLKKVQMSIGPAC